jgi:hypothetical protein
MLRDTFNHSVNACLSASSEGVEGVLSLGKEGKKRSERGIIFEKSLRCSHFFSRKVMLAEKLAEIYFPLRDFV